MKNRERWRKRCESTRDSKDEMDSPLKGKERRKKKEMLMLAVED